MDQPNTIDTADGVVVQADGTTLLAKLCFDGRARLGELGDCSVESLRVKFRELHGDAAAMGELTYTLGNGDNDELDLVTDEDVRLAKKFGTEPIKVTSTPRAIAPSSENPTKTVFEHASDELGRFGLDAPAAELKKLLDVLKFKPRRLVKAGLAPAHALKVDEAPRAEPVDDDDDDDDEPFVVVGTPKKRKKRKRKAPQEEARSEALERIARFDLRPREVREHLDRYVVRQDDAKKVLSVAICDHYNVVRRCLADDSEKAAEYSKPNILVLGPSGSGKTYIMRTLAKLLGVPFVKADATKFTETGIVGEDAEDLVRSLVEQADGDVALAQYGIIYVDEIDKLCRGEQGPTGGAASAGGASAAGNRGVQNTFLKVMEETDVSVNKQSSMIPQIFLGGESPQPQRISTKHVLFIFSGAFTGLDARLKAKHAPKAMGFGIEASPEAETAPGDAPASFLKKATSADFVDAGLETEFIGRIPVRVAVDPLGARDLELILMQSEGSVLRQYERDFKGYGVDLTVERDAISAIAAAAAEEKTGARGLVTVLERTFREFKYELPCAGITELGCDAATVADPRSALDRALAKAANATREAVRRADCRRVEASFGRRHAPLTISLAPAAEDFLVAECAHAPDRSLRGLAGASLFDDGALAKALKRIYDRTGRTHFELSLDLVLDRDATLKRMLDALPPEDPDKPDVVATDEDEDEDEDDEDDDEAEEDAQEALRMFLESDAVAS